jgi:predicted RNase H-like HicB family nuclease
MLRGAGSSWKRPSSAKRAQIGREGVEWGGMNLDDYKVVLYRNQPDGWIAEVPAIPGCYALMPTREEALAELGRVFEMIAAEYGERGLSLPADSTAIVNA